VKSAAAMLLWMLIALLPLNGYASASASNCAARHQPPAMAMPQHAAHAHRHGGMQPMTMPAHDGCHCPASCIAQCGTGLALGTAAAAFAVRPARTEMPVATRTTGAPPSPLFELLRPPKTIGL
jgi:hypothetical protein